MKPKESKGIIRANHPVVYPEWVKNVVYFELESDGPVEFNVSDIEQWLYPGQGTRTVTIAGVKEVNGWEIYKFLRKTDAVKNQLGLADLLGIKKKGRGFFDKHFGRKNVFGWKSVVLSGHDYDYGGLFVPCLISGGDGLFIYWRKLTDAWSDYDVGMRFSYV